MDSCQQALVLKFIKLTRWKGLDSQRGRVCPPPSPREPYLMKTWHPHFSEWQFPLLVYCYASLKSPAQVASFKEFSNAWTVAWNKKALLGKPGRKTQSWPTMVSRFYSQWGRKCPPPQGHGGFNLFCDRLVHPHHPELQETPLCAVCVGGKYSAPVKTTKGD